MLVFDATYPRGSVPGEPGYPNRPNEGLRDLYCYWIDTYLRRIENNGRAWAIDAKNALAGSVQGQGPDGQNWIASEMTSGAVSPGRMRFGGGPAPVAGNVWMQSAYGMWNGAKGMAGPF